MLVIGASTGSYGRAHQRAFAQAARRRWACSSSARPSHPPGTPGWHNSAAFHKFAQAEGLYARINGDAFSDEIKRQVIEAIRADLARSTRWYTAYAPRRSHPRDGKVYTSALKPVGRSVTLRVARIPTARSRESTLEP